MRCAVLQDGSAHHHHHGNLLDDKVRDDKLRHGDDEHEHNHQDGIRSGDDDGDGRHVSDGGSGRSPGYERVQRRAELVVRRGGGLHVPSLDQHLPGPRPVADARGQVQKQQRVCVQHVPERPVARLLAGRQQ